VTACGIDDCLRAQQKKRLKDYPLIDDRWETGTDRIVQIRKVAEVSVIRHSRRSGSATSMAPLSPARSPSPRQHRRQTSVPSVPAELLEGRMNVMADIRSGKFSLRSVEPSPTNTMSTIDEDVGSLASMFDDLKNQLNNRRKRFGSFLDSRSSRNRAVHDPEWDDE
jgi:hypothetical protein